MSLQTKYRTERDGYQIVENDNYFFSYKLSNDKTEAHVYEVYIREDLRGHSGVIYDDILNHLKKLNVKVIVGFIVPKTIECEKSMMSLLKFGFKIHSVDNEKIILIKEVDNG